ncbi:MAG: flagellar basal body rod protein FlgC [Opitutales bacterium]|nr:flagellar basal body rod protein FlgC [Opitutales bacterium]
MSLIPGIDATKSALDAERLRLDIIAQNIANAQTTRDFDGQAYQRRVVVFEQAMNNAQSTNGADAVQKIKVSEIGVDETPGPQIYDPQHPHANEEGMVQMPNVQLSREMVDLITATRAYEANLKVVSASRQMASKALEIGRG